MSSKLVIIANYTSTAEAGLARDVLENEGITCRVTDEMIVEWLWYVSNAVGGVKILVAAEDADRARAVLAECHESLPAEPPPEGADDREEENALPGDGPAARAWRAAIIGLFLCPPTLHFYSVWLLARVAFKGLALSQRGGRNFSAALLVNAAVFAAIGLVPFLSLPWMSQFWSNIGRTLIRP